MTNNKQGLVVMAIDPGFTGAIALYDSGRGTLVVEDMPVTDARKGKKTHLDLRSLFEVVERSATFCDVCVVEQVGAMPMQGRGSTARFMYGAGAIDMAVIATGKRLVKWTPAQWKMAAGLRHAKNDDRAARKTAARLRAMAVFPAYAELFARVKDDGRAEAALIAWAYAQHDRAMANPANEVCLKRAA